MTSRRARSLFERKVWVVGGSFVVLACAVTPAQPPSDLTTHSREEPIRCDDCAIPFLPTRHYHAGRFRLAVSSSPKTEEFTTQRGTRKRQFDQLRIEISTDSGLRLAVDCVDEYSFTQSGTSLLALDIVDGYRCTSGAGTDAARSLTLSATAEGGYSGELVLGGERYALSSLREHHGGTPGSVRGFAFARGTSTLAAWRAQRGSGPERLWIGRAPAPTELELAFFLSTLFFGPGKMPL